MPRRFMLRRRRWWGEMPLFCATFMRRVRRHPPQAQGVAVSAALRLRCGARFGLGHLTRFTPFGRYAQTRSGKYVHEVRFAHRAQNSAPRRPALSLQWVPPAAQAHRSQCLGAGCRRIHKAAAGQAPARICGAEKRRIRGRVRSTPREHSCRFLFERSERSERSELSDGHEPEHRRAAGAKRRPPHLRAGACPDAALTRKPPQQGIQQ
jgi:hypothetical protein